MPSGGGTHAARHPVAGNYCWTHGHRIGKDHTSATCAHKAASHRNDATAANTLGGSEKDRGWDLPRTRGGGWLMSYMKILMTCCYKTIFVMLYCPAAIPPTSPPPTLELPTLAPVVSILLPKHPSRISTTPLPLSESRLPTAAPRHPPPVQHSPPCLCFPKHRC